MKEGFPVYEIVISYTPLADEEDPTLLCPPLPKPSFCVPSDKNVHPFLYAEGLLKNIESDTSVGIIIPGQQFDALGTRQGRGGGWYDKFLSRLPQHWNKIGFCNQRDFSIQTLRRAPWDVPMDYIVTVSDTGMIQFEYEKFY